MPLYGDIIMIHAEKVIKSLKNLSSRPVGSVTPTESNQGTFTIKEPDTTITSRDIEKIDIDLYLGLIYGYANGGILS